MINSNRRSFVKLLPAALLAGCGFKLRTVNSLGFTKLATNLDYRSALAKKLKFLLQSSSNVELVEKQQAEVFLEIVANETSSTIASYDSAGFVHEQLVRRLISVKLRNQKSQVTLIHTTPFEQVYTISFPEGLSLAKEDEVQQLLNNMENEILNKIVIRITAITSID